MPNKRKELKIEGPNLWYLVGLITSDGYISTDRRHIDITSTDYNFLRDIKLTMRLKSKIGIKYGGWGQKCYRIQIANKNFYNFLLSIGLMSNKSCRLRKLCVPKKYFVDFLRGLIDGDGCIRRWTHPTNKGEQWSLRIYSGSEAFIKWLKNIIESILKVIGKIHTDTRALRVLKFGKMAARIIAQKCYYEGAFALKRKKDLARACIDSYRGWNNSKTVIEDGRVAEWFTRMT